MNLNLSLFTPKQLINKAMPNLCTTENTLRKLVSTTALCFLPLTANATEAISDADGSALAQDQEKVQNQVAPASKAVKAKNIELDKPVEKILDLAAPSIITEAVDEEPSNEVIYENGAPFTLLGSEVAAGTATRLAWSPSQSFEGIAGSTPVLVVNGKEPGPVLCLTAAVHGDELNGIEIVRRLMYDIEPSTLTGTVIGVPIVNLQGFRRASRYLTDRRDLNRFFPGNPDGSSASRIAHSFFTEVIAHCGALVDLHTGSFHRTNLPQLRADLTNPEVMKLSQSFGSTVVLHSDPAKGTLREAATSAGIPTVTLEAGGPMQLQDKEVAHGVKGVETLLNTLGMVKRKSFWGKSAPVFYQSTWVRASQGGILFSEVYLGKRVRKGDLLGTVTDPVTNQRTDITSPENGRILGMAINQVVMPGFAAFRIGMQKTEDDLEENKELASEDNDFSSLDKGNIAPLASGASKLKNDSDTESSE